MVPPSLHSKQFFRPLPQSDGHDNFYEAWLLLLVGTKRRSNGTRDYWLLDTTFEIRDRIGAAPLWLLDDLLDIKVHRHYKIEPQEALTQSPEY
jgi:hypothetical protein